MKSRQALSQVSVDGSSALGCKHQGEAETLSNTLLQAGRATRFFSASALDVYRRYKEGQLSFGGGEEVCSHYAAAPRSCLCPWQQPSVWWCRPKAL